MLVLSGAGSVHYLVPGCDYIIGRRTDSDIFVQADVKNGVSRHVSKHACLTVAITINRF